MSINLNEDDTAMREVLTQGRVIALVGYSNKPERASYQVGQFLRNVGYRVYPVNPAFAEIDGLICYANLTAIPEPIDIVNVFRRSEFLVEIVQEAIATQAKTVWAQTGIFDPKAAEIALNAGLNIAMNCCIKIEYIRLKISLHS
jgi:predicted CoA-binding protein